jgi:hypothetical protein
VTEPPEETLSDSSSPRVSTDLLATRHNRLKDIGVPLIVAMVALLSGIAGSIIGGAFAYNAATGTEVAHEAADKDAAQRSKRADVYLAYLDAANKYALASQALANDVALIAKQDLSGNVGLANDFGPWKTARSNYQGEVNQVYVYGSDNAWQTLQAVAATLPAAVGPDDLSTFEQAINNYKWPAFNKAYGDFLAVFCREVPASPRGNC